MVSQGGGPGSPSALRPFGGSRDRGPGSGCPRIGGPVRRGQGLAHALGPLLRGNRLEPSHVRQAPAGTACPRGPERSLVGVHRQKGFLLSFRGAGVRQRSWIGPLRPRRTRGGRLGRTPRPVARRPPASRRPGSRSRRRAIWPRDGAAVSRSSSDSDPARMIADGIAARFGRRAGRGGRSASRSEFGCTEGVPHVGEASRQRERAPGPGAADPDRRMGLLHRAGPQRGARGATPASPRRNHVAGATSRVTISSVSSSRSKRSAVAGRGCRAPSAPSRTRPRRARARAGRGRVVDGERLGGQHRGVPVGHAGDEEPEPDA